MAKSALLQRAFFLGIIFTSAAALPASALTSVENTLLNLLQVSSPYLVPLPNLTVPSIEGFSVEIRDSVDQRINHVEMFCNSIFAMIALARYPWDSLFPFRDFHMTARLYASELRAQIIPPSQASVLKPKHLIMGIYELGRHFVDTAHYNYEAAFLSINGRVRGVVSLQNKTPARLGGQNATANNSSLDEVVQAYNNTSVADEPGIIVDPRDVNFVIHYDKIGGNRIYYDNMFTAFIDALANASPNDVDELGGSVNSVGHDGRARLVIIDAGTTERPVLTWGRCIQAIAQLWRGLLALHEILETIEFDIEYAGEKLGTGLMKAVTPITGNGTAITRRVDD